MGITSVGPEFVIVWIARMIVRLVRWHCFQAHDSKFEPLWSEAEHEYQSGNESASSGVTGMWHNHFTGVPAPRFVLKKVGCSNCCRPNLYFTSEVQYLDLDRILKSYDIHVYHRLRIGQEWYSMTIYIRLFGVRGWSCAASLTPRVNLFSK